MRCPICKKRAEVEDYLVVNDEMEVYYKCKEGHEITLITSWDVRFEAQIVRMLEAKSAFNGD